MDVGFSGGGDARQVERGGGITGAADGYKSAGVQGCGGKHVVVRRGWSAGGTIGADVHEGTLEKSI